MRVVRDGSEGAGKPDDWRPFHQHALRCVQGSVGGWTWVEARWGRETRRLRGQQPGSRDATHDRFLYVFRVCWWATYTTTGPVGEVGS